MAEQSHSTPPAPLISVIIPVYNGERYVEQAVRSVLGQPRDVEVALVEDGSTDGSLEVCGRLAAESDRVRLLRHPGGRNRGAGASRNLGIRRSRGKYIAFLDADDYYLPNRFEVDVPMLEEAPSVDGVYGAVRTQFEADYTPMPHGDRELATLAESVEPEDLFATLLLGSSGAFHTAGITARREVFEKAGMFDEGLVLAQDSAMWLQMAATCRLASGSIEEPVAVWRRHAGNRTRVDDPRWHRAGCAYVWSVLRWARRRRLGDERIAQLRKGLALTIVGRLEGTALPGRVCRVVWRTLYYGYLHLPVLPEVGWLFIKKALGRSRADYSQPRRPAGKETEPE